MEKSAWVSRFKIELEVSVSANILGEYEKQTNEKLCSHFVRAVTDLGVESREKKKKTLTASS